MVPNATTDRTATLAAECYSAVTTWADPTRSPMFVMPLLYARSSPLCGAWCRALAAAAGPKLAQIRIKGVVYFIILYQRPPPRTLLIFWPTYHTPPC